MKYRKFGKTGENVSVLGFGMMRLPMLDGSAGNSYRKGAQADIQASIDMLRKAIDSGINYVDTAYNYLSGMSEKITGMAPIKWPAVSPQK